MNVVLAAFHAFPSPQAVPLANAFLAAFLSTDEELSSRVSITLLDFFVSQSVADCVAAIIREDPAAVGLSLYQWNRQHATMVAKQLKRLRPDISVFAGGPEATADPQSVLSSEAAFDFIIVGEGERPFLDAMAALLGQGELAGVKGVALGTGAAVSYRAPMEILDSIPSPYLNGILDPQKYGGVLWQLSRGCDFACDYCFDVRGKGGVRRFSLDRIEQELILFALKRVPQVFVLDSTFNVDLKRAKAILRLIRRNAPHVHFHFEARSEFLDRELASLFADIRCSVQIGLQSADPNVLKAVHRQFNRSEFPKKIALLNETGVIFGFDLIYGLPNDSFAGFAASIDFALDLVPNHLDIFPLAILPGTKLHERAGALGITHLLHPPYTVIESPSFSPTDMKAAARLASACDIFYSRGKAVAWFQAIRQALGMKSSELLIAFADWLENREPVTEERLSDHEIWELQREFLTFLFRKRRMERLVAAALDHVDYNYHYAAALLAPEPQLPTDRELASMNLLRQPFRLSAATSLARFNYEVFELLEGEGLDLSEFCRCFKPTGSFAAIYPRGGEIYTESLIEPYFRLLERLDGRTMAGEIAAKLNIGPEETASFLEFAAAEGIIIL